jgi:hypothetical protein
MQWVDGLGRPTFPCGVGLPTKRHAATAPVDRRERQRRESRHPADVRLSNTQPEETDPWPSGSQPSHESTAIWLLATGP